MATVARIEGREEVPPQSPRPLSALYEVDETEWLDIMARLAAERRHEEFDFENLSEFLTSMARRDRRAVYSRLVKLLSHLLKWEHQGEKRTRSWHLTIVDQRQRLAFEFGSKTLRHYAESTLSEVYRQAVERASAGTGLAPSAFPPAWEGTLDDIMNREIVA